jgi:mannose-6-phosphate isomerase-like protein (cupin superfamily)
LVTLGQILQLSEYADHLKGKKRKDAGGMLRMKAGKIWGQTELIHANGVLEFHRIEYKKDVACSKHRHKFKWNGFYVESGKMMVRVWQQGKQEGLIDETILNAGDFTRVKPGLFHEFIGLEDGVAFELYWAEFDHNDIERESQGHKINEKE